MPRSRPRIMVNEPPKPTPSTSWVRPMRWRSPFARANGVCTSTVLLLPTSSRNRPSSVPSSVPFKAGTVPFMTMGSGRSTPV